MEYSLVDLFWKKYSENGYIADTSDKNTITVVLITRSCSFWEVFSNGIHQRQQNMLSATPVSSKIGILNKDSLSIINNQINWLEQEIEGQGYGISTASCINDIHRSDS